LAFSFFEIVNKPTTATANVAEENSGSAKANKNYYFLAFFRSYQKSHGPKETVGNN
jgi:hypothetical protein